MYQEQLVFLVLYFCFPSIFAIRGIIFDNRIEFKPGYICNFERYEEVSGPFILKYHCQFPGECYQLNRYRNPMIPFDNCALSFQPLIGYQCCHPTDDRYKGKESGYLFGFKSYIMCLEYAKYVCVNGSNTCEVFVQDRMHNKNTTRLQRYPYLALIGYQAQPENNWYCRGSIVSPKYILTTASCKFYKQPGQKTIMANRALVGFQKSCTSTSRETSDCESYEQLLESLHFHTHPAYDERYYYHDIGLMLLAKEIQFNHMVRPACLYSPNKLAPVTGWFATYNPHSPSESPERIYKPEHIQLTILPNETCNTMLPAQTTPFLHPSIGVRAYEQFCAGKVDALSEGPCGADDVGGALVVMKKSPYCIWQVVGVLASKPSCEDGKPGIYTRVRYYFGWLESLLWQPFRLNRANTSAPSCFAEYYEEDFADDRC